MQPYIKNATADTPEVNFNAETGIFELSKMSLPEDAVDFYSPIVNWLSEYAKNPKPKTEFSMKLEYFNTASSKQLIQLLLVLQEIEKNNDVIVKWYYKEIDEDLQALGEEYSQIIDVPFQLIEIS